MTQYDALLVGDDVFPFHDVSEMSAEIDAALGEDVDVEVTTDRDRILDVGEFDLYVDYTTDSGLTADQLDALLEFVEGGGGYLGIHCASDLTSAHDGDGGIDGRDEPLPELRELLGGHFLNHPEQSEFRVEIVGSHPVVEGVSDFTVYDEPYMIDADEDRIDLLARMDHDSPDMEDYPVVWTREHGDGRVCYSSLGHTVESLENADHRRILRNGVDWVTGN